MVAISPVIGWAGEVLGDGRDQSGRVNARTRR